MAFGLLEVIFVLIFIAAVVIALVVRSAVRRSIEHPDHLQVRCGSCGYPTTGISTFFCPECGSDLRVVGMWPRRTRAIRQSSGCLPLVLWSICWIIAASIISSVLEATIIPTVHQVEDQSLLVPSVPGRIARVDFRWMARYRTWPNSTQKVVDSLVCDLSVLLDDGTISQVQIDMVGSQYEIILPAGIASAHNGALDKVALNTWMTAIGVDVTNSATKPVLFYMLYGLLTEPARLYNPIRGIGANLGAHGMPLSLTGHSSSSSHPPELVMSLLMLTYFVIWVTGCLLIVRGGRIFVRKSDKA